MKRSFAKPSYENTKDNQNYAEERACALILEKEKPRSHSQKYWGGEGGYSEVQIMQATCNCFFLHFSFTFFSFLFTDRRKLVLQRNTSRCNIILSSREAFDRCHMNHIQCSLKLAEREGGGCSLGAWSMVPGETVQAAQAQGTEASQANLLLCVHRATWPRP